jgi:hypothetical protein
VRGEGSIAEVFEGTIPFFLTMIVMTAILIHFRRRHVVTEPSFGK